MKKTFKITLERNQIFDGMIVTITKEQNGKETSTSKTFDLLMASEEERLIGDYTLKQLGLK